MSNKIKEFQWKCIHNIIYTENRRKEMNMSNGKCHLCQVEKDIMLGYHEGDSLDNIIDIIIYIFKWELWKIRNKIIYNGINLE